MLERERSSFRDLSTGKITNLLRLCGYTCQSNNRRVADKLSFTRKINPVVEYPRYHLVIDAEENRTVNFHIDSRTHKNPIVVGLNQRSSEIKRTTSSLTLLSVSKERDFLISQLNSELLFGLSQSVNWAEEEGGKPINYKEIKNHQQNKRTTKRNSNKQYRRERNVNLE